MKKNIFALSAIVALHVFSTCEKASTSGLDDSSPGNSNFYVLNLKKEAPRPGFTLLNAESYQQTTEYTCGPAATLSLLRYFGKDGVEMTIASEMATSSTKGTTPEQMTSWLSTHGF
jgi:hypothetical protein